MIPHKKPFGFGLMDVVGREECVVFQVGLGLFLEGGGLWFWFFGIFFFWWWWFLVGFLKHPLIQGPHGSLIIVQKPIVLRNNALTPRSANSTT